MVGGYRAKQTLGHKKGREGKQSGALHSGPSGLPLSRLAKSKGEHQYKVAKTETTRFPGYIYTSHR